MEKNELPNNVIRFPNHKSNAEFVEPRVSPAIVVIGMAIAEDPGPLKSETLSRMLSELDPRRSM